MINLKGSHKFYGIQNRFLRYSFVLLVTALLMSGIGIGIVVGENIRDLTSDKLEYINQQLLTALETEYNIIDDIMKKCILQQEIQDSLRSRPISVEKQQQLKQYLSYVNHSDMNDYIYVDNKHNSYTKPYRTVSEADLQTSGLIERLGSSYSKTVWIWKKDDLFQSQEETLFAGRYVRNMEYRHPPGILFFKFNPQMLQNVLMDTITEEEGSFGIISPEGNICALWEPGDEYVLDPAVQAEITSEAFLQDTEVHKPIIRHISQGIVTIRRQESTGFYVFSFIPDKILNQVLNRIYAIMVGICILAIGLAGFVSIYFARRFTKPIQKINSAMTEFTGEVFSCSLEIHTNTELDSIGKAYNKMVSTIQSQVEKIKQQEKNIRTSELNSLMYQINPHFLYNTLDTIYMLARINKEETTMKMIQSLSAFLKVSLSKGNDVIYLEDELNHVTSYMEIQKIRNTNLFQYEICCDESLYKRKILKLILQPLVENSIKHGFAEIYEGGFIKIHIYEEENSLVLSVENNGLPISDEMRDNINQTEHMSLEEISSLFADKKNGYGVTNVISRLRLKYGASAKLCFQSSENGTVCIIRLMKGGEYSEADFG